MGINKKKMKDDLSQAIGKGIMSHDEEGSSQAPVTACSLGSWTKREREHWVVRECGRSELKRKGGGDS